MRQANSRLHSAGLNLHLVVVLQHRHHATQHLHAPAFIRLVDLDHLEAARERRILLEILLVLRPGGGRNRAKLAAGKRGLEQIGGISRAGSSPGTDQGVRLIDEEDGGLNRGLNLVNHLAKTVLELALHACSRLEHAEVERANSNLAQCGGHITPGNAQRESLDNRGLADTGLAREDRIVLPPPHQDVDDLANLLIATEHRVNLSRASLGRQVLRVARQRTALGAFTRHGPGGLARSGAACRLALTFLG